MMSSTAECQLSEHTMDDANSGRRRVFPLFGRAEWEASMLRPAPTLENEDKPRASESCLPRAGVHLGPHRQGVARHSFDSPLPVVVKSRLISAPLGDRRSNAVPEAEESRQRISTDLITPPTLSENHLLPPTLNYTLRDRKLRIAFFWCFILFDCAIVPTGLYFILWYDAGPGSQESNPLDANTVLSIVTATIGGTAILEYVLRMWKLFKKSSNYRVG